VSRHAGTNSVRLRDRFEAAKLLIPDTRDTRVRLWGAFLLSAIVLMIGAALYRVPVDLWRLAFEPLGHGASTDLKKRFIEVHEWFAGRPVYGVVESADYPPASYLILFPLTHWPTLLTARLVAALSMTAALGWLTTITVEASGSQARAIRWFAALLPLSMYATAANIRIGQVGIYLMPLLLVGTLLLAGRERSWRKDLVGSALLTAALVKPTFSVPFMWIAFFRGGIRPMVMIPLLYVVLTVVAASFQDSSLPELIRGWLGQSGNVEFITAHANIHTWLGLAGLEQFLLPASLLVLLAAGAWTWWYRRGDIWILLGVAAIVSRFWSYHRWYDDILMLVPLITLLRMIVSREATGRADWIAIALMVSIWAFGLAPEQVRTAPAPWGQIFKVIKATTWLATLAVLLVRARPPAAR
jgi:glycosyl transferase family 87